MKIRVIIRKERMVYVMLIYKLVNTSIHLAIFFFFKIVFLMKTNTTRLLFGISYSLYS